MDRIEYAYSDAAGYDNLTAGLCGGRGVCEQVPLPADLLFSNTREKRKHASYPDKRAKYANENAPNGCTLQPRYRAPAMAHGTAFMKANNRTRSIIS